MAHFVAVVDPDPKRRAEFLRTAASALHLLPGLSEGRLEWGDFAVCWAAGPNAPVSSSADAAGAAVLFGRALRANEVAALDADGLRRSWQPKIAREPALDGLHLGIAYSSAGGLVAGADPLGLLPLCWWDRGDVLLAATSPELFTLHPEFKPLLEPSAFVALLLLSHCLDGLTLWRGVRRLGAGSLLVARPKAAPCEESQFQPRGTGSLGHLSLAAQAEALDHALAEAVARHAAAKRCALLLSGGRDSRMLAVLLARRGCEVAALTRGRPGDVQARCSAVVARALGFSHAIGETPEGRYLEGAERVARWEQLAGGMGYLAPWGLVEELRGAPPTVVAGYVMDPIVGGSHVSWARSRETGVVGFEPFFGRAERLGLGADRLKGALRRGPLRDLVEFTVTRSRQIFEDGGEGAYERAWAFDLRHRQRFHVGKIAWPLSFGSWPVFPAADRRLVEVCAALPPESLEGRRLQDLLLRTRYPEVAHLPVDRNSLDDRPLAPTPTQWALERLTRPGRRLWRRLSGQSRWDPATVYYYRAFDVNGPGWRAVREAAEPGRAWLEELFDPEALKVLVPAPAVEIAARDTINHTYGMKMLLGFMLRAASGRGDRWSA